MNNDVKMDKKVLREIRPMFDGEEHILVAYLFGSTVKGTAGKLSDVDVAVLASKDHPLTLDYQL